MGTVSGELTFTKVKNGEPGPAGPPTGAIDSPTIPENPYDGMLWNNTGTIAGYINAVYRWDGSSWDIWELSAQNIKADTFTGYTFLGAEFINTFDFLKGFDYYLRGDTTIKDAGIVIEAESYSGGNVFYNQRLEYSANVGGLYVQETSPTSQLGERWVLMTPTGIGMYDGRYASTYGQVNLKYQDFMSLPKVGIPAANGWEQYNTSASSNNYPSATRNGRVVQLAGAFKNKGIHEANATSPMGTVPIGYRPANKCNFLVQGTGHNIYLLVVKPDGQLTIQRYRGWTGSTYDYKDCGAGSWLNIACTYVAADI